MKKIWAFLKANGLWNVIKGLFAYLKAGRDDKKTEDKATENQERTRTLKRRKRSQAKKSDDKR